MKIKLIFLAILFFMILIEASSIFFSNSIAGTSMEVSKIKTQIEELEGKNANLRTQLLSFSSFESIASRAAGLGFSLDKDTALMINAPLKVALR